MKITLEQIEISTVRLITLNEPFASLMAFHGKQETRGRNTKVRGLVCIHSAKIAYPAKTVLEISGINQYNRIQKLVPSPVNGKILSIGYLVGTKLMGNHQTDWAKLSDMCFVKYQDDLWIWEFEDMTPIEPIYFKGSQGWTVLNNDQKMLIKPL